MSHDPNLTAHRFGPAAPAAGPNRRTALALAVAGLGAAAAPRGARAQAGAPIRVGSKIDTEGSLLGGMIVLALRNAGLNVEDRTSLGPTRIVRTALLEGAIDIYPEYTGNGAFFLGPEDDPAWKNARAGFEKVRDADLAKNNIVWMTPAPANNTWAIAVRRDLAESGRLRTLDDLARHLRENGAFKLAASAEFVESPAALPAFQKAYGFSLDAARLLVLSGGDTAATIRAAANGTSGVNAAMAYGTDGALAALNLVVLEDIRAVQPVYAPAPVARKALIDREPRIPGLLEPIFKAMTLDRLQSLNARIAVEGQDAKAVAAEALKAVSG